MGSAQKTDQGIWLRVWTDGEMEYEYFDNNELQPLFDQGLSNTEIVMSLGGALMKDADEILDEKRKQLTED